MTHLPFEVAEKEGMQQVWPCDPVASRDIGEGAGELDRLVPRSYGESITLIGALEECCAFVVEAAILTKVRASHFGVAGDVFPSRSKAVELEFPSCHDGVAQCG